MRIVAKVLATSIAAAAVVAGVGAFPTPSYAGDRGAIALGALGGFMGGAVLGSALAGPRYYAPPPPPPVYSAYYPAYAPAYGECFRRRVWGPYGWHWITEC